MNTFDGSRAASQWWRWPLMPFAAFFGSLIGSYLFSLVSWFGAKFRGGYSEDGWYYLYVMPVVSYTIFGWLYAYISRTVAPHSKNIAGAVMVTLFGVFLLGLIFVTWNLDIARSEAIRTTIGGIAAIIAAIICLISESDN
jgi:hypothetical protein